MIEILRLAQDSDLVTAEVFEELFAREVGRLCNVRTVRLATWCRAILGPPSATWPTDRAARRFAAATRRADLLCPNWQSIVLAPVLLSLRNRSRAPVRLLLIAHAPGSYALEWALIRPLLRPGDRIIAPSENAKAVIEYLCADLARWIRVVPHPMAPLPTVARSRGDEDRLVSLGRIVPGKLLHRQIEAMDVLRSRGRRLPVVEIAGAVEEAGRPGPGPYARSLTEKIRRLGLADHIRLVGVIKGAAARADFLSHARALLNLSVTIEESFGKAPVEALGLGVPVLGTRWNGLPETIGACGALVPVLASDGGSADVSPHAIADAIEQLVERPPSHDACVKQAAQFAPAVILPKYEAVLDDALRERAQDDGRDLRPDLADEPAAPPMGLLAALPPLTRMSWVEFFDHYLDTCRTVRASWEGVTSGAASRGDQLRALVLAATRRPLEQFLAGRPAASGSAAGPSTSPRAPREADFIERAAASAVSPGLLSGRFACLGAVRDAGRVDLLALGVEQLEREGVRGPGLTFLRAEAALLAGNHRAAFDVCRINLDLTADSDTTATALRQLARIARQWRRPSMALPLLAQWLDEFPDSTESGPVWLDRSVNGLQSAHPDLDDARFAMERARALLGNHPVVEKVSMLLAVRIASVA